MDERGTSGEPMPNRVLAANVLRHQMQVEPSTGPTTHRTCQGPPRPQVRAWRGLVGDIVAWGPVDEFLVPN